MAGIKIAFYTAVTNSLLPFSQASAACAAAYPGLLETVARDRVDLCDDAGRERFRAEIKDARILLVQLMGGAASFPAMESFLAPGPGGRDVFVLPSNAEAASLSARYSTVGPEAASLLARYMLHGGERNWRNMLLYLASSYGAPGEWEEPRALPWQAIYHPDRGVSEEPLAYRRAHLEPGRPTIGIWFHRGSWISGNLAPVDALIREVERRGANALAVFFQSGREAEEGCLGVAGVLDRFMMHQGSSVVDAVLRCMMFNLTTEGHDAPLRRLGVPIVNVVLAGTSRERWEADLQGLDPVTLSISVVLPELDGSIISVPVAFKERSEVDASTGARAVLHEPHAERVRAAVGLAASWARLRRLPNSEKRVAILFHNYPPGEATIGTAYLLDSVKSVWNIVNRLRAEGYLVEPMPEGPEELIRQIKSGFTADPAWSDPLADEERAVDVVPLETYHSWVRELPGRAAAGLGRHWGEAGEVRNQGRRGILIPGRLYGNVYVGIQPSRGFAEDPAAVYHSPDIPPPYYYYAYYRWLRDCFGAHAILHIGKHGSLEWLPGKGSGLSALCFPDIMIADIPNIYPYVINNPGEGTQAKRRSAACIVDHNVPVLDIAGTYDALEVLERLLDEYREAEALNPQKLASLRDRIIAAALAADLHEDLETDEATMRSDFASLRERLHRYLERIRHTFVRDGLHCLGEPPEGEMLHKMLYALTRLPNGDVPSLHDSVAVLLGGSVDRAYTACRALLARFAESGFDTSMAAEIAREVLGSASEALLRVMQYVAGDLRGRLARTTEELDNTVAALGGRFVPPGPSGSPSRGMAHILPTGRNFTSVDPRLIPTAAAWGVGSSLAAQLLERYRAENGSLPRHVGMVVWGSPTMRTKGDDVAEVLSLLGVRPVWNPANGMVTGIEPIPLRELGRHRVDVTVRLSGFFRDAFPQLVDLMDRAVRLVAALDEPEADNAVRESVRKEAAALAAEGHAGDEATVLAGSRLFGPKPGAYGAGVNHLIDNRNWKDNADLARVYLEWGAWTYSAGRYGVNQVGSFRRRLEGMEVAVKNVDHRESDIMDSDDFYQYHGGMVAAVKEVRGQAPACYIGDSSDPRAVQTFSGAEESRRVFRTRVLNPKWIQSMKRHGHKGALDIARTVDYAFGWDATAGVIGDWMYRGIQSRYLDDEATRRWMQEANPAALHAMLERLLEAVERGMWSASAQELGRLKEAYLRSEESLEARGEGA